MSSSELNYQDFESIQQQAGLRMVVVKGIPSPWSEAAKGIFQVKQLEWTACYHDPSSREMSAFTGSRSAPVALYNDETPLISSLDILMLAERLKPNIALLPQDPEQREEALAWCQLICGENGLGWNRRLDSVHKGLNGLSIDEGGYPQPIAGYLAKKYGYQAEQANTYAEQTISILTRLAEQLKAQSKKGSQYYLGNSISAVDIYSATFMACFKPLSEDSCPMYPPVRAVFEALDEATKAALDPILLQHRDYIYQSYLALPLSL